MIRFEAPEPGETPPPDPDPYDDEFLRRLTDAFTSPIRPDEVDRSCFRPRRNPPVHLDLYQDWF